MENTIYALNIGHKSKYFGLDLHDEFMGKMKKCPLRKYHNSGYSDNEIHMTDYALSTILLFLLSWAYSLVTSYSY
jgi:hypothetical protein